MFNEKTHAFIVASYYKQLTEQLGKERGEAIFIKASQKYAEQRGARMALRAMRDGYPLDYASYFAYGEWYPTIKSESKNVGENNEKRNNIFKCAWAETFKEMGLQDCGKVYCYQIDAGIVRGFNPDLQFKTHCNLSDSDYCDLQFIGSDLTKTVPAPADGKKDWVYHCAHTMRAYGDVCHAILGNPKVYGEVHEDFQKKFGDEMLIQLIEAMQQDFTKI